MNLRLGAEHLLLTVGDRVRERFGFIRTTDRYSFQLLTTEWLLTCGEITEALCQSFFRARVVVISISHINLVYFSCLQHGYKIKRVGVYPQSFAKKDRAAKMASNLPF